MLREEFKLSIAEGQRKTAGELWCVLVQGIQGIPARYRYRYRYMYLLENHPTQPHISPQLALTGQASVEHVYRNYDSRVLRPHKAVGTMAIWLAGNATSSALLQMYKLPSL